MVKIFKHFLFKYAIRWNSFLNIFDVNYMLIFLILHIHIRVGVSLVSMSIGSQIPVSCLLMTVTITTVIVDVMRFYIPVLVDVILLNRYRNGGIQASWGETFIGREVRHPHQIRASHTHRQSPANRSVVWCSQTVGSTRYKPTFFRNLLVRDKLVCSNYCAQSRCRY